jgi:hypothetical protein
MTIYEKLIDFVSIIMLTLRGIFYLVYEKANEFIIRIQNNNTIVEAEAVAEEAGYEPFYNSSTTISHNANGNDDTVKYNLYKPDNYLAVNDSDYNKYSIEDIIPKNIVMPNNYKSTTTEFETENTEYDYKNYSNVDGAGVHLQHGWQEISSINRPWFETCLSDMDCEIVKGTLEKFDYVK